ncbi:MAG: hypothetical protein ACI36Y_08745 [Coriobacteriales bacterium]
MRADNLFRYATSELSQDAFVCWLLSHATEEAWDGDIALRECALEFLGRFMDVDGQTRVAGIETQHLHIDVLVTAGGKKVIIEDKTFTMTHDDQVNAYRKRLVEAGEARGEDVVCVFYKIADQQRREPGVDYEFDRAEILRLLRPYARRTSNPIFLDYLERVEELEEEAESWRRLGIGDWTGAAYGAFFKHLVGDGVVCDGERYWWGYVPNPTGGFMGLCWFPLSGDELCSAGITEDYADEVKLQIEDDRIALKIDCDGRQDPEKTRRLRSALYEHFRGEFGGAFQKLRWRTGRFMTVGFVAYDEGNYAEQIKRMEATLRGILGNRAFREALAQTDAA